MSDRHIETPDEGASQVLQGLMSKIPELVNRASEVLEPIADTRANLREKLLNEGWIQNVPPTTDQQAPFSMCAIDGARVTERMYGADLLVAVATCSDALYSQKHEPSVSEVWAEIAQHNNELDRVVGAAMATLELKVATKVTHQIRLLDGSFITPVLEFMKGVGSSTASVRESITDIIVKENVPEMLTSLLSRDPNRPVIALPKSETATHYGKKFESVFHVKQTVTDRVMASQILDPGEILIPRPLSEWEGVHIQAHTGARIATQKAATQLTNAITPFLQETRNGNAQTCYFKPDHSSGVIRLEYVSDKPEDFEKAFEYARILSKEINAPHTLEPTAQWAVDRKAKSISIGVKALRAGMLSSLTPEQKKKWGKLIAENYRT